VRRNLPLGNYEENEEAQTLLSEKKKKTFF
jgi:hypothetical protein